MPGRGRGEGLAKAGPPSACRQAAELAEILGILTRMLAEREEGQAV